MSHTNNHALIQSILQHITLDLNQFEPTDSEGCAMEGPVIYQGKTYFVFLSAYAEESYKMQAAMNIAKTLSET